MPALYGPTDRDPILPYKLAAVQAHVEKLAGAKVELSATTDPALMGGLCVRIGDWQIDASVSTRLARLRKQLLVGTS